MSVVCNWRAGQAKPLLSFYGDASEIISCAWGWLNGNSHGAKRRGDKPKKPPRGDKPEDWQQPRMASEMCDELKRLARLCAEHGLSTLGLPAIPDGTRLFAPITSGRCFPVDAAAFSKHLAGVLDNLASVCQKLTDACQAPGGSAAYQRRRKNVRLRKNVDQLAEEGKRLLRHLYMLGAQVSRFDTARTPSPSERDAADDELMRKIIKASKYGPHTRTSELLESPPGISRSRAFKSLRRLGESGEYAGHVKKKSPRYRGS
jgi:hypothetical protein